MNVRVNDIAVANPAASYTQTEMLELLGLAEDDFARMIFDRCGVERRHFELTPDLLDTTLQERTVRTEEQLLRLAIESIDPLKLDPAEVGTVVTATYYSLGGPTLARVFLCSTWFKLRLARRTRSPAGCQRGGARRLRRDASDGQRAAVAPSPVRHQASQVRSAAIDVRRSW